MVNGLPMVFTYIPLPEPESLDARGSASKGGCNADCTPFSESNSKVHGVAVPNFRMLKREGDIRSVEWIGEGPPALVRCLRQR